MLMLKIHVIYCCSMCRMNFRYDKVSLRLVYTALCRMDNRWKNFCSTLIKHASYSLLFGNFITLTAYERRVIHVLMQIPIYWKYFIGTSDTKTSITRSNAHIFTIFSRISQHLRNQWRIQFHTTPNSDFFSGESQLKSAKTNIMRRFLRFPGKCFGLIISPLAV